MPGLPNGRHELFAQELAAGSTADAAYEAAGYKPNRGNATRLKADESVAARVAELQRRAAALTEATIAGVLAELWAIGVADPSEIVEYRRTCCRHCWGKGHRYQETPRERADRRKEWDRARQAVAGMGDRAATEEWDDLGGIGFNGLREPCSGCPECFGEGFGEAVFKDTRTLSPAARRLYAGVKVTKDGVEVKMHDKVSALTKVGQHLGMFVERNINTDVGLEEFLEQLDRAGKPGAA